VRFPALRARNLPVVRGRVRRLSADSLTDPATGETYFRTEVIVPPEQLEKLGASASQIRVGMPTEMVILLRKRSTLQFIIEPLTRSLWLAGKEG
jgi:HlyD family secretion protein